MALQTVFDRLLDFPVFQGLGRGEMEDIIAHTRFDFHKYAEHTTLVKAESVCDKWCFILSGKLIVSRESDDHSYTISEEMFAPVILEPEALFSYKQRFTHTVVTSSPVGAMTVHKEEVQKFLELYPIIRMNMVNNLSTHAQELNRTAWKHQSDELEQRFVDFIANHCVRKAGWKGVMIKMTDLARELNDGRLNVSRILNKLQKSGHLQLHRGGFTIPALEHLINRNVIIK